MLAWVAASLCVVRAVLREQPRWWLGFGAVVGLATANKLLIALLVVSLAVGLAAVGPRRLPWRWVLGGLAVAAVLATPALLYQVTNGFPQVAMGQRLSAKNGPENRALMGPFLLLLLGPVLVPIWVAGLRSPGCAGRSGGGCASWRWPSGRCSSCPSSRPDRSTTRSGCSRWSTPRAASRSPAGCPGWPGGAGSWWERSRSTPWCRRSISLPLVPVSALGSTPVPSINQAARDQVGWPAYVGQVAAAIRVAVSGRAPVRPSS